MSRSRSVLLNALLLIAACAVSTGAWGQRVYRCGTSYSQTPCPDGAIVDADDARSAAQKTQADQATLRDVKTANTLEKTRLKDEKAAVAQSLPAAKDSKSKTTNAKAKTEAKETAQKKSKKKKEPEFFTAKAAPEKKTEQSKPGN
jgi:hypothetical protein